MRKTFLFLAALLVTQIASAVTWTDMLAQVRVMIKDTHATNQRFTDTQLLNLANEGQREVNIATWAIMKSTAITLVSGTTYYSLPTDYIAPLRVTRDYKLIKEVTIDKLDADFNGSGWQLTGGVPSGYYIDQTQPDKIGIYPYPNSSSSTGTLRINYVAQASTMTSTSSTPYNGIVRLQDYAEPIIFYVSLPGLSLGRRSQS
jgi:hypothetical protein